MPGIRLPALAVLAALAGSALGQQPYPGRPIRLVVPFPPGGPADSVARPLAQKLAESLGQPVVIDNRAGATGTIGGAFVAKAPADGYTLLMGTSNELSMSPGLYAKLPYDPGEDFAPLTTVIVFPNMLAVHPVMPVKSARELIALARASPGRLNFATSGIGSTNHLTGELFRTITGLALDYVPYKGGAPAVADLMGGHVDAMFATVPSAVAFVRAGKLKALMVTDRKRWDALPGVPNATEAGLPALVVTTWNGVLAPAGTPVPLLERLHAEIVKAMNAPDMRERMIAQAAEVSTTSREAFAAIVRRDFQQWLKLIRAAGIRVDG